MRSIRPIVSVSLSLVYLIAVIYHVHLWIAKGWTSIIATLLLYLTLGFLGYLAIRFLFPTKVSASRKANLQVFWISLLLCLFAGEIILKYGIRKGLSYSEATGKFHYRSRYKIQIPEERLTQFRKGDLFVNTLLPNSTKVRETKEFTFTDQNNEWGLRERSIATIPKGNDTLRVLGLGDSFTEGVGVHQNSTWLRHLERQINAASDAIPIYTINAGRRGSDPVFEYHKLKYFYPLVKPDIVILSIGKSDLGDIAIRGGLERFERENPFLPHHGPAWEPLYAMSMYVRYLVHGLLKYNGYLLSPQEEKRRAAEARKTIGQMVEAFAQMAEEKHFRLIVVLYPTYQAIQEEDFRLKELVPALQKIDQAQLFNLYEEMLTAGQITPDNVLEYYWEYDSHMNIKGYSFWGERLGMFLMEENENFDSDIIQ